MINSAYEDKSGAGYTAAGSVIKGVTKVFFNKDNTLIGNIRPTPVDIQNIKLFAPEGEDLDNWMINIQTFTPGAGCAQQFGYFVRDDDEGLEWDGEGWYDFETYMKADKTFDPGEGFMLNSAYEDISTYEEGKAAYIEFPAVIAE